jgi:zinc transport system substrate-binding protein
VPEAELRKRGEQLRGDLKKLDEEFRALRVTTLLASHPVYNYLARRYRWDLQSVHWEPGENVTAAQWAEFDKLRLKHPATIMLWEDEPLPAVRAKLEKRGIRVVVFETCGNTPVTGDYLQVMQRNIGALRLAIERTPP